MHCIKHFLKLFTLSFHISQKYLQVDAKRNISVTATDRTYQQILQNKRKNKTNMTS